VHAQLAVRQRGHRLDVSRQLSNMRSHLPGECQTQLGWYPGKPRSTTAPRSANTALDEPCPVPQEAAVPRA
jgi:hypothetical protein